MKKLAISHCWCCMWCEDYDSCGPDGLRVECNYEGGWKNVPYDKEVDDYPIPEWCPLPDATEDDKPKSDKPVGVEK